MMLLSLWAWCPSGERESGKEGRTPSYWLYSYSIYVAKSTVPILGSGKGERLSLSASRTTCTECGTDHGSFLQDELSDLQPRGDESLHPWRYYEDRRCRAAFLRCGSEPC